MDDPRLVALGLVPPAKKEDEAEATPETNQWAPPVSNEWAPAQPAPQSPQYTPPANPFSAAASSIPQYADPFTAAPAPTPQPPRPAAPSIPSIFNAPNSPFAFAPPAETAPPPAPAAPTYTPSAFTSPSSPFTTTPSTAAPTSFPAVTPASVPLSKKDKQEAKRAAEAAKKAEIEAQKAAKIAEIEALKAAKIAEEEAKKAAKIAEQEAKRAAKEAKKRGKTVAPTFTAAVAPAPVPPPAPPPAAVIAQVRAPAPAVRLEPIAPPKTQPWDELMAAIAKHPAVIRKDVRSGLFRTMRLELAPIGVALVGRRGGTAYSWSEVKGIEARRGRIELKTEANRERVVKTKEGGYTYTPYVEKLTRDLLISIDGAGEPNLAQYVSRVMDDMRSGKFNYHATSWLEYENAIERLKGEFSEHDDQFVPAVAGALFAFTFVAGLFVLPEIVNLASDIRPPAGSGAFVIQPRYGWFDVRSFVMAVGLSALVTRLVLRLGLGSSAMSWARGTLRGWHTSGPMALRIVTRELARLILGTSVAAAMLFLGFAAFAPTVATTLVVDSGGIRETVPLPVVGIDKKWSEVSDVLRTEDGGRLEGFGVTIRFSDGRTITTVNHDLSGGTDRQLLQRATSWHDEATR